MPAPCTPIKMSVDTSASSFRAACEAGAAGRGRSAYLLLPRFLGEVYAGNHCERTELGLHCADDLKNEASYAANEVNREWRYECRKQARAAERTSGSLSILRCMFMFVLNA